jgi:non-ribosomal peptide synthetase component E (peptide arylation enzyme)
VLSTHDGVRPSVLALRQFCVDALPRYMMPDRFDVVDALPRTSTDKIDYQSLLARAPAAATA